MQNLFFAPTPEKITAAGKPAITTCDTLKYDSVA